MLWKLAFDYILCCDLIVRLEWSNLGNLFGDELVYNFDFSLVCTDQIWSWIRVGADYVVCLSTVNSCHDNLFYD